MDAQVENVMNSVARPREWESESNTREKRIFTP